ncbi:hypothetical protein V2A60_003785 [Cordyceps javanica]
MFVTNGGQGHQEGAAKSGQRNQETAVVIRAWRSLTTYRRLSRKCDYFTSPQPEPIDHEPRNSADDNTDADNTDGEADNNSSSAIHSNSVFTRKLQENPAVQYANNALFSENQSASLTPTFRGHIASTLDALVLFESCLNGMLPRVPRRPHDRERQDLIKSGSIFIYEEHYSGIKRWTDGVSWSPSRILGNFLIYRELEKSFAPGEKRRALKKNKESSQGIAKSEQASHPNMPYSTSEDQERSLIGSLVDSYHFKNDGLVKKTISICFQGVAHHMVSYYNVDDIASGKFETPTESIMTRTVTPRPELLLSQNFRTPVDGVEYAVAEHTGAVPAQYAFDQGSIGNSNGVLPRAMLHGNLQTAISNTQQGHQGSSPAAYMFPQQPPDTHNGYPGHVTNSAFQAAMLQQMSYPANPVGNYTLDPNRGDRFVSAAVNPEFPRNMPQASSSRRASLYDASGHRSDIGMPFGSSGTEARPMASNSYLALRAYYMTQQHQGAAPSTQASSFPMSRGLRSESNAIPADDSVNHSYSLNGTAWNFEPPEGDSDQQQAVEHSRGSALAYKSIQHHFKVPAQRQRLQKVLSRRILAVTGRVVAESRRQKGGKGAYPQW